MPGKRYVVTGYVKTNCIDDPYADECYGTLISQCVDANHEIILDCSANLPEDQWTKLYLVTDWTEIQFSVVMNSPYARYLRVLAYNTPPPSYVVGDIWYDKISVTEYVGGGGGGGSPFKTKDAEAYTEGEGP